MAINVEDLVKLCSALSSDMSERDKTRFIVLITEKLLLSVEQGPAVQIQSVPLVRRSPNQSRILAKEGDQCVCSNCKKVAYTVVGNVYAEGMSGEDFLACFNPTPPIPVDMLTDEYGNECVDCPLCKGDKTVVFLRRS